MPFTLKIWSIWPSFLILQDKMRSLSMVCLKGKFEISRSGWQGMRLACLYSGGKDSTYSAYLVEQQGHRVCTLVNIVPSDPYSWVFHTLNLEAVPLMAQAMGKRLVSVPSDGTEAGDLEALRKGLKGLNVEGVVVGAIASDYQWDRINGVCESLGLRSVRSHVAQGPATPATGYGRCRCEGHNRRRIRRGPGRDRSGGPSIMPASRT